MTTPPLKKLACVLLVDRRGWVLLQERDSGAPIAPDKWGMPGGHVEDGEEFEAAAYRELEEETGLRPAQGELVLWRDERFRYRDAELPHHYQVFVGSTDATDDDVVVGEGRRIVFVDPARIPALDKSDSCEHFVTALLGSPDHARLAGGSSQPPG